MESTKLSESTASDDSLSDIKERAETRYRLLKTKAVTVSALSDNYGKDIDAPQWFDPQKYQKCMYLARKYFLSLYISHFVGLLLILQIPTGLKPLLATRNSLTVSRLFRRYLSTLMHVKAWYDTSPFEKDSRASKSLMKVRSMHKQTAQLMNSKTKEETGRDKLWLNQYDFVMTQWAFIGPAILYPKECGLHPATDDDIEHFIYLWRVIGFCIGIEDQFNLCSGNLEEDRELCRLLFDRDYRPVLHSDPLPEPLGWEMGKGIALALKMVNPSLSFEAITKYWYPRLQIPKKCELTTTFSKLSYLLFCFNFQVMLRFSIGHWIYGMMYRLLLALAVKRKQIKSLYLQKLYPDLKFEEKCPLSIDIGYYDAFNESMAQNEN